MSFSPLLMGWWDKKKKSKPKVLVDKEKEWRDKVNKKLNDKKTSQ